MTSLFSVLAAITVIGGIGFALWKASPRLSSVLFHDDDPDNFDRVVTVFLTVMAAFVISVLVVAAVAGLASLIGAMA